MTDEAYTQKGTITGSHEASAQHKLHFLKKKAEAMHDYIHDLIIKMHYPEWELVQSLTQSQLEIIIQKCKICTEETP